MKTKTSSAVIAQNIRKLLAEKNITQEELANTCERHTRTAWCWANGRYVPNSEDIRKICIVYQVSADELLGIREGLENEEK